MQELDTQYCPDGWAIHHLADSQFNSIRFHLTLTDTKPEV
jgi:hypothetical protein